MIGHHGTILHHLSEQKTNKPKSGSLASWYVDGTLAHETPPELTLES